MQKNLKLLGVIAILGASLAISGFVVQDAMAAKSANKSAVYTAEPKVITLAESLNAEVEPISNGTGVIAQTIVKTSNPTDLLILYSEECSLYTEVNLKGKNADSNGVSIDEAHVSHTIRLLVDGEQIGNSITMCDRTYGIETNTLSQIEEICATVDTDEDDLVCQETFLNSWINTKAAHGWNWVVVNLGDFGTDMYHTIQIDGSVIDEQGAYNEKNADTTGVVIGDRSLLVIPTHLDVDA